MINKFNIWYDNLREPRRFLTAMLISSPVFLMLAMSNPYLVLFGFSYALLLIFVRIVGRCKA